MLKDVITDRLKTVDGVTYSYDPTRSKWLSVGKSQILYGINHRNINTSRWLAMANGIYSNNMGFKISDNGTITKAIVQSKNSTTCKFMIIKESMDDPILTLKLNNNESCESLDIDIDKGNSLRCYMEIINNNTIDYPFVMLEYASKID